MPRLVTPAVTTARSWPSKRSRRTEIGVTARFAVSVSLTGTVVSVTPDGRRSSSVAAQALFWKSLMSTTSFRGRVDSASTEPATFTAGAKRVASGPGLAAASAASSLDRSSTDCRAISAVLPKKTREARSPGASDSSTPRAAAWARVQRSP